MARTKAETKARVARSPSSPPGPAAAAAGSWWRAPSLTAVLAVGALARAALLVYGEWQDANCAVKYTDIDYVVFTDAARFLHEGHSPFRRATYRYTPLLAAMLTPNIWLHRAFGRARHRPYFSCPPHTHPLPRPSPCPCRLKWVPPNNMTAFAAAFIAGKALFCVFDLLVGWLIHSAARTRKLPERTAVGCAAAWLLNPIAINVSTRGNAEAVLCVLVVGSVALLLARRTYAAAVCYGLAVHFKLYPIIYAPALALAIDRRYCGPAAAGPPLPWWRPSQLLNQTRVGFGLVSAAGAPAARAAASASSASSPGLLRIPKHRQWLTMPAAAFAAPTALYYHLYGWEFLWEAYLYHFARTDHRHNFSVYFYLLYLQVLSQLTHTHEPPLRPAANLAPITAGGGGGGGGGGAVRLLD